MFTLVQGFYKQFQQKQNFYVVIIGLDNSGKTVGLAIIHTLLEYIKATYNKTALNERVVPTVGLNVGKILKEHARLNFWDLGGQASLHSLWQKYFTECHGIIFVVDSTDKGRISDALSALEKVIIHESVEGIPLLMLANKQDQADALEIHEIKELLNPMASRMGARESTVLPVSALTGEGVENSIDWILKRMQNNIIERPPVLLA